jgi:AcrR family transcriptional regulator
MAAARSGRRPRRARKTDDERTSRAIIRDEALKLFAERGADAVTVRQIATAAGVSAALVVRHFKSKDGLRDEIDQHVLRRFEDMLVDAMSPAPASLAEPEIAGSFADAVIRHMPPGSPIPAYMRRMLLDGSRAGQRLFRALFAAGRAALDRLVEQGMASPGEDVAVRAAFLTANDLAVLLLRDPIADVLGVDPLSADGMGRWAAEVLAVYAGGLGASPPPPPRAKRR